MGLFKPAWQSNDYDKALKAVKKITDQTLLARVLRESNNINICLEAAHMLEDRALAQKYYLGQVTFPLMSSNNKSMSHALEMIDEWEKQGYLTLESIKELARNPKIRRWEREALCKKAGGHFYSNGNDVVCQVCYNASKCKHDYIEISRRFCDTIVYTDSGDSSYHGEKHDRYIYTFKCKNCGNIYEGYGAP